MKHNQTIEVIEIIEINANIRAKLPQMKTNAPKSTDEPEESSNAMVVVIVLAVILLIGIGGLLAARRLQTSNKWSINYFSIIKWTKI